MDALTVIAPLIGVVLGSALTGFGTYLKERRERKRNIAIALSDLLEIRHRLIAIDIILSEIRKRVNIPTTVMPNLRNYFESLLPPTDGLNQRYDNAVSLLAGVDPVLAFSLRSKNTAPGLLSSIRNLAISSGAEMKEYEALESTLRLAVTPNINDAAIKLANQHSWRTRRRVEQLITKSSELPLELESILDQLKAHSAQETGAK